jgi:diguanylate cyclase (GGDEF)-like protein/putative nucleotidyltransferase with HDIG domain
MERCCRKTLARCPGKKGREFADGRGVLGIPGLIVAISLAAIALLVGRRIGRLHAEAARSSDLALANALSREVGGLVDLEEVFRTAVSMLGDWMPHEGVAILRRAEDRRLVLVAGGGELRIEAGYVQSLDEGLLGLAVRSGQTIVSNDVRSDPRCVFASGMTALRSEAVIPIRDRDHTVQAVLDVMSARTRRFGPAEVSLLETVAAALEGAVTAAGLYERLAARAAADPLTGLPNHRTFQERLTSAITHAQASGQPLSLCLLDLDRFKEINDAHGHQAGDHVLAEAARSLAESVRAGETLARVGGDEFAWILPGADLRAALTAAERARAVIARSLQDWQATVSVGVCDLEQAEDADELFRLADGALYWAKAQGRDLCVTYSPDIVEALSAEERATQAERRQALKGLRALARAVDAKDQSTRDHSERVAIMAVRLARQLGWPEDAVARLREAALLHDVGKIGVPDAILRKEGPLDPDEYETIKGHASLGAHIAAEVLSPEQTAWVRGHHERFDGAGYPDDLAAEAIPLGARILAVADAWDAMTSDRHYRRALSPDAALAECMAHSGSQLCPTVVAALVSVLDAPPVPEARHEQDERYVPPALERIPTRVHAVAPHA